ncbi:MAG: hypothetical protein NTV86_10295 [Planctomycetota bacterium]|nr:hypothetical protein [Planctomycetota bacterium]
MPSWTRRSDGLTLVEAVVGTAILGSLLVALLMAAHRLNVQARRSQARLEACRIADELLAAWWPTREDFPTDSSGPVAGREGWRWRTSTQAGREDARRLGARTVALEVFAPPAPGDAPGQAAWAAAKVEILLPDDEEDQP